MWRERTTLDFRVLSVNGRIRHIKMDLNEIVWEYGLHSFQFGHAPKTGSCEHCNEPRFRTKRIIYWSYEQVLTSQELWSIELFYSEIRLMFNMTTNIMNITSDIIWNNVVSNIESISIFMSKDYMKDPTKLGPSEALFSFAHAWCVRH
jgi:hypothetical protein